MKNLYAFFVFLFLAFTSQAQYIYNDYDANQNVTFYAWPNAPIVIPNPYPSGINTSATVAQWDRSNWAQWDNVYTNNLPGTIDFTTGTVFSVKIYSPITCDVLFKLEGNAAPVERLLSITTPNQWVQLNFDFAGEATDTYNKLVFFIDFATFNANTFYFDDIEGPAYGGGGTGGATLTLPITFDDPDADYDLIDFGGNSSEIIIDPDDSNNNIVETIKSGTAELWAGTTVGGTVGLAEPIPFAQDTTLMSVRVWSPETGIPVRLKAEDATNPSITVETEAVTTVAMQWDTLLFNFAQPASGTPAIDYNNNYNKLSIFFNFGTTGAESGEQTYYWDDIEFVGAAEPKPLLALDIQDNFENDGWGTIDEWYFQDPNMNELTTTTDPENEDNTVANYNRSGSFMYTNAQFVLDHRMDLSVRNKFNLDVYFPSSNDYSGNLTTTAAIKLQNSLLGGNAWTTQTEVILSVEELDTWVTLTFDFSSVSDREDYDQVVVQLGGEGHWVPGQFYFDNLDLEHIPFINVISPNGGEEIEQNSSYTISWDFNYWGGDVDITLLKEGGNPEPIGLNIAADNYSFEWTVPYNQVPGEDYVLIITSVDNNSIADTSDFYFTILEVTGVQSNFVAEDTKIALGGSTTFTDLSSGEPDTWLWSFEGGNPETFDGQYPPEIAYNTEGTFDVTLIVYKGDDADTTSKQNYITVGLAPTAQFEASATQILTGQSVDYTNLSSGTDNNYHWIFDGGAPDASVEENPAEIVYNDVGEFDVTLIATNDFGSDTLYLPGLIKVFPVGTPSYDMESINVFPNPAINSFFISLPEGNQSNIELYDLRGQLLISMKNQTGLISINTASLQTGLYIILVRQDGNENFLHKKIRIQ